MRMPAVFSLIIVILTNKVNNPTDQIMGSQINEDLHLLQIRDGNGQTVLYVKILIPHF